MQLKMSAHVDTFTRDNLPPEELWPTLEFTIPDVQYPETLNAGAELIDRGVAKFGHNQSAFHTPEGEVWTYGELQRRANQVAQVLTEDYGVVPGNRVMLRGPNNPWQAATWLGVLKAGAVVVTTMPMLWANEVQQLIELTKPTVLITDYRNADGLAEMQPGESSPMPEIITYGADTPDDLVQRANAKVGDFTAVQTAADDVALLGPTSGTTGVPKVTIHFHRDILANADTFAKHVLKMTPDDVIVCSAPFAFTFGLGSSVVFPLRFGASALLVEKAAPVEFAEAAERAGVTIMATAPTAYRAILKEGRADLLRRLRAGISAGEALPEQTFRAVEEASGIRLIDGIGATELLHIFISAAGEDIRPGCVGKPIPGFRATILDDDGNEAPAGQAGRLAVIGPTGCRYLADPRQASYVHNGWNVTGDTFIRTEDGYFIYQARSDNMIISSGYNIAAPEVENAINQHPDVLENAVVGRPDEARGSVVCAFIVLREDVEASDVKRKEIQDFVKQQIAPYKYPRDIRFVSELPRNPSGKLQHYRLRELLKQEAQLDAPARPQAAELNMKGS